MGFESKVLNREVKANKTNNSKNYANPEVPRHFRPTPNKVWKW